MVGARLPHGTTMTVREAALETIRLTEARNTEDQAIDNELGGEVGYPHGI